MQFWEWKVPTVATESRNKPSLDNARLPVTPNELNLGMILSRGWMVCTDHLLVSYFLYAPPTVRSVPVRVLLLVLYHFSRCCWGLQHHRYPNLNLVDQPQALLQYQIRRLGQNQEGMGHQGSWQPCRWVVKSAGLCE